MASPSPEQVGDDPLANTSDDAVPRSDRERIIGEKRESCVPFFDALWFCYSPVHQMREYYTYGTVDDCTGHWGKLTDCLKRKTIRYKEDAPLDPNAAKHPLWQLRTGVEAKAFWRKEFSEHSVVGDSSSSSSSGSSSNEGSGEEKERPTMV